MPEVLEHHGIKGQKWGVRRDNPSASAVPSSGDHVRATTTREVIKTAGTRAVSNDDLNHLVNRMNLEQRYSQMVVNEKNAINSGNTAVRNLLGLGKTLNDVNKFVHSPVGKAIRLGVKGDKVGAVAALAEAAGGKKQKSEAKT